MSMIDQGAKLGDAQIPVLVDYLSKNWPVKGAAASAPPAAAASPAAVQSSTEMPADYKGKAGCPDGQFWDVATGSCWSCPEGYSRTIFPVDGTSACEKPARSLFSTAT